MCTVSPLINEPPLTSMILNWEGSESMLLAVAVRSPPPPLGAVKYLPLLVRNEYVGVEGSNIVEKRSVSELV